MKAGDMVKVHPTSRLYVLGREWRNGKRRVWSYTTGRSMYLSAGRLIRTGYNIHTSAPYEIPSIYNHDCRHAAPNRIGQGPVE